MFGRRYAMSVECVVFTIGVIIQITADHVWQQFAVGRFISGLGVGALSAAVPMVSILRTLLFSRFDSHQYQAETAPSQIRGTLTYDIYTVAYTALTLL
jgi:MFS family permease